MAERLTLRRAAWALFCGALVGSALTPFATAIARVAANEFSLNGLLYAFYPNNYLLSAASAFISFVILLLIALPIWIPLHQRNWTQYRVAIALGAILSTAFPILYSLLENEEGTTFIFYKADIVTLALVRAVVGAIVSHVIWRIAYGSRKLG
jgi:hypothetical protein